MQYWNLYGYDELDMQLGCEDEKSKTNVMWKPLWERFGRLWSRWKDYININLEEINSEAGKCL
jgi:hypothetical protein